jgi:prepilin-type N-terminal cleavage/methylation domain-containing protein
MNNMNTAKRHHSGYTLIEVLVGIVIFAVGMMALAQLQGHLSKASADSTARTVATNIAEERIERARSFSQIPVNGTIPSFAGIVSSDAPEIEYRGNIPYSVDTVVTDYYYNPATEQFQENKPDSDIIYPDLKRVELTVSWGAGDNAMAFRIDDTRSTTDLGTGSVTVVDLISSFTTGSGAKVRLNNAAVGLYSPPVDYNPGQNPDIVSINLGDNKFKESTTPQPDVLRADELVETAFDVVTYSNPNDGSGATFLRREEFRAISCECTLRLPGGDGTGGKRPTVWNGSDYSEGEFVSKPYGVSASNQQSKFCDLCCRDHHDGGYGLQDDPADPGRALYNPFRPSTDYHGSGSLAGDHKHYSRNQTGVLVLADTDGARYLEACRMVRKDGFFRVAQDLRQEGLNAFPGDFLDEEAEINQYSDYVTAAVKGYEAAMGEGAQYELSPPGLVSPGNMVPAVVFPASSYANATQMSDANGVTEQQLRSRGIYLDYMSDELRLKINCMDAGGTGAECDAPRVSSPLEIIPFYDVQLTWLSRWNESPANNPIDVSNEAIADNNTHSRGLASLQAGFGYSTISSSVHSGNLGLTGTDPIDPWYLTYEEKYNLYAKAVDSSSPPVLSGIQISGSIISAVAGLKAAAVEIEASEAQCNRTNTGFLCIVEDGAKSPSLKVSKYDKAGREMYACSANLALVPPREHISQNGTGSWTNFSLELNASLETDIIIKEFGCY